MSTMTLQPRFARTTTRPAPPARTASTRLTRRGRLTMLLVWLAVALVVGFTLAAGSAADVDGGAPAPTQVVVVGPGQTLWDIAASSAAAGSTEDLRDVVVAIQELNDLDSAMLRSGQQLLVPLG